MKTPSSLPEAIVQPVSPPTVSTSEAVTVPTASSSLASSPIVKVRPLSIVGSQALFLCQPLLGQLGQFFGWADGDRAVAEYATLLEDPANVDRLLSRLEGRSSE